MKSLLCESTASSVFHYFLEISKIPRASGNTAPIAEYLVNFAKERGLYVRRDAADNVVIRKAATQGYEGRPTVILQGHTDIVAQKLPELDKDMDREGVEVFRDGDFLRAKGTTLGGDDGVAIAYALALLDSKDIPHPTLEVICTSDEEIGLLGAVALDTSDITGKMMINVDSDDEGMFTVGCAGGQRSDVTLPVKREGTSGRSYELSVAGLLGGHSGVEIDKGRENATKILGECLAVFGDGVRLITLSGGSADNAIPRECRARIALSSLSDAERTALLAIEEKYRVTEADIKITLSECAPSDMPLDALSSRCAISLINSLPSGVIAMSEDIPGLVETSLNLGIAKLSDTHLSLSFSIRSAKAKSKAALAERVRKIGEDHGAFCEEHGAYPAWEYKKDSPLRDAMCKVYERMYGKAPTVVTIHAGLECGIFSDKIEGLDCVSMGPDNFDIHTTEEHLSISSTERVWEYLKEVLKNI